MAILENSGQRFYEVYSERMRETTCVKLMPWSKVPKEVQAAMEFAADEVIMDYIEENLDDEQVLEDEEDEYDSDTD